MGDFTTNFSHSELECSCCREIKMDKRFMELVEALRLWYGKPMVPSSGYRCPNRNDQVSSTGRSGPHTTGKAIDFVVSYEDAFKITKKAFAMGFTGIGVSQKGASKTRFLHLDTLTENRPRVWSY